MTGKNITSKIFDSEWTPLIIGFLWVVGLILSQILPHSDEPERTTYTKAICDQDRCRDYVIVCRGDKIEEIIPIGDYVNNKMNKNNFMDKLC